jgi:hypothetical protein
VALGVGVGVAVGVGVGVGVASLRKGGRFCNRPAHCEGGWAVRAGIRAYATPSPSVECIAAGGSRAYGNSRCATPPPATGTCTTTTPGAHRQVILFCEVGGVGLVGSGSDSMGDSSFVTPATPQVLNPSATALGRSRGDGVT